ncbi:MAG: zinc ribbon domain-containing protein [Chloroflexaceae bacterium]|nr:zinc ribbon domain-containing protein [Chloroflexaceae bacterium]
MPMYEYGCRDCTTRFDQLRRMEQDDSDITCPCCGSSAVQRRLSVFAAHSKDGSGAVSTVAATGGGCCGGGGSVCGCASRN